LVWGEAIEVEALQSIDMLGYTITGLSSVLEALHGWLGVPVMVGFFATFFGYCSLLLAILCVDLSSTLDLYD
jgi:hypothetical protein